MSYRNYEDYKAWGDQDLDFDGCLECSSNKRDKKENIIHKSNCRWAIDNNLPVEKKRKRKMDRV